MKLKQEANPLIETFREFKENKGIDRTTLVRVLEESFRSVIAKTVGSDENYDVIVNPDSGDLEIYRNRVVVADDEVTDTNTQISLSEAQQIADDYEEGEDVSEPVDFSKFGRRAILTLRQTLASKILDLEHDALYNKYKEKVGELITAEVYQLWKRDVMLLDEDGNELLLPKSEQIPSDFFRKGEPARAVVARVDNATGVPKIILSRTSPVFLQRLLETEVPEIAEGIITVKKIARVPGNRAKIAVESYDDRIDPVGACVGVKGSRIHGIVRELRGENLDVIAWTSNPQILIARALAPATISSITLDEAGKQCSVALAPDQVSLAIGSKGINIRLATMLTGTQIDVFREVDTDVDTDEDDDILLDEFRDEIDGWVIDVLEGIGLASARQVLDMPLQLLIQQSDLEEETVTEVLRILNREFAEGDADVEQPEAPETPETQEIPEAQEAPEAPEAPEA